MYRDGAQEEHLRRCGAGENPLLVADNLYGSRPREGRSPAELWKAFGRSIPFLDKQLRNTAYFLASAIWNEDEIGAERYRDCLLRWLDTLRPEMQTDILLSHHALLTPDLFALDWAAVETRLQAYRRHPWPELPPPEAVFAIILRGFDDVLLITAGSGSPGMTSFGTRTSARGRQHSHRRLADFGRDNIHRRVARSGSRGRLDFAGIALLGGGLSSIVWALIEANSAGWGTVPHSASSPSAAWRSAFSSSRNGCSAGRWSTC